MLVLNAAHGDTAVCPIYEPERRPPHSVPPGWFALVRALSPTPSVGVITRTRRQLFRPDGCGCGGLLTRPRGRSQRSGTSLPFVSDNDAPSFSDPAVGLHAPTYTHEALQRGLLSLYFKTPLRLANDAPVSPFSTGATFCSGHGPTEGTQGEHMEQVASLYHIKLYGFFSAFSAHGLSTPAIVVHPFDAFAGLSRVDFGNSKRFVVGLPRLRAHLSSSSSAALVLFGRVTSTEA
ncbi:hypothetical protein B0H14DRAFT_3468773 [Mycena olivaceomarginata]|nr:hypothetical protein B0H14DRAFT_3468773 [Mycena olivaceomarginata]